VKAVFLANAKADVEELRRYIIKRFGAPTWHDTRQAIQRAIHDTLIFPLRGHIPDELLEVGMTQYRQILVDRNRIIYEVRGDILYIHIVCDVRRDLQTLLARRMLRP